jgi:hypothetical protein
MAQGTQMLLAITNRPRGRQAGRYRLLGDFLGWPFQARLSQIWISRCSLSNDPSLAGPGRGSSRPCDDCDTRRITGFGIEAVALRFGARRRDRTWVASPLPSRCREIRSRGASRKTCERQSRVNPVNRDFRDAQLEKARTAAAARSAPATVGPAILWCMVKVLSPPLNQVVCGA